MQEFPYKACTVEDCLGWGWVWAAGSLCWGSPLEAKGMGCWRYPLDDWPRALQGQLGGCALWYWVWLV